MDHACITPRCSYLSCKICVTELHKNQAQLSEVSKERDSLVDLGNIGIILKWILTFILWMWTACTSAELCIDISTQSDVTCKLACISTPEVTDMDSMLSEPHNAIICTVRGSARFAVLFSWQFRLYMCVSDHFKFGSSCTQNSGCWLWKKLGQRYNTSVWGIFYYYRRT
jgi:hypothetical protein